MDKPSQNFLQQYLSSLPPKKAKKYNSFSADYFCSDEHNANICANLVLKGEKSASCSLDYWYSEKGYEMPKVGNLQVVTKWDGQPVCIIELTKVLKCKFKHVTEEFAAAEGEGDKSLSWWREAHWQFFSSECEELGIAPSENMMLVLEHFKVVWR